MPIVSWATLQTQRTLWRDAQKRLVFTNGVFDLLHSGHVFYLEEARRLGDILVVGINSDASTRAIKGPTRPLISEHDRAYMLAALRTVDYVTIFSETTAEALVDTLRPDIYVKGGDYALDPAQRAALAVDVQRLPEARVVMAYGGQVQLIPTRQGCSTSALIARILATAS